jgi:hypothetical protein
MSWNNDTLPLAWGPNPEDWHVICIKNATRDNFFEVRPKYNVGDTFKGFPMKPEPNYIYVDLPYEGSLEIPANLALDCCNIGLIPPQYSGIPDEFQKLHIYITKEQWDNLYLTELTGWPFRGPGGDRPWVYFGTNLAVLCVLLPKTSRLSRILMDMMVPRNKPHTLAGGFIGMYAKAIVTVPPLQMGSIMVMPNESNRFAGRIIHFH